MKGIASGHRHRSNDAQQVGSAAWHVPWIGGDLLLCGISCRKHIFFVLYNVCWCHSRYRLQPLQFFRTIPITIFGIWLQKRPHFYLCITLCCLATPWCRLAKADDWVSSPSAFSRKSQICWAWEHPENITSSSWCEQRMAVQTEHWK